MSFPVRRDRRGSGIGQKIVIPAGDLGGLRCLGISGGVSGTWLVAVREPARRRSGPGPSGERARDGSVQRLPPSAGQTRSLKFIQWPRGHRARELACPFTCKKAGHQNAV